jgi:hypothetical protein
MKTLSLLFVFFSFSVNLFAGKSPLPFLESQRVAHEKLINQSKCSGTQDWNAWKAPPYSSFKKKFSLKSQDADFQKIFQRELGGFSKGYTVKNWKDFKTNFLKKKTLLDGKKVSSDAYERTLFEYGDHQIVVHAEKEKNLWRDKNRSVDAEFQKAFGFLKKFKTGKGVTDQDDGYSRRSIESGW